MNISTEQITKLRTQTGLSFKEIKDALTEAGGDEAKALEILKSRGGEIAAKKSARQVKEGSVASYVHATKKTGSLIELLCETDFVAKNADFQNLAHDLAMQVVATKPADAKELLEQPFVKDPSITVQELINQHIAKLGENIQVGRFIVFEV